MIRCPHCNKDISALVEKQDRKAGDARASLNVPVADIQFLRDLDGAGFELSDFEASFIESALQRAAKYGEDGVRFSEKQAAIVAKLREKYEGRIGGGDPDAPPEESEEQYQKRITGAKKGDVPY